MRKKWWMRKNAETDSWSTKKLISEIWDIQNLYPNSFCYDYVLDKAMICEPIKDLVRDNRMMANMIDKMIIESRKR